MSENQLREAYTLMKQGDKKGASRLIQEVLKEDRSNLNAWWLFSHVLEDEEKVVKSLEKVLALNPEHIGARKRLAQMRPEYAHLSSQVAEMAGSSKGKIGIINPEQKKTNKTSLLVSFVVFAVVCIITMFFPIINSMMDANALANVEGPGPEEVALLQFTAAFNGDYETMRYHTCDSLESEWMDLINDMNDQMSSYGADPKEIEFDFSHWQLEEVETNGRQKIFSITGQMVMRFQGQTIEVDVAEISGMEPRMILVVNDNRWVVCSL